jgi:beta-ureidopropionase
MAGRTLSWLLAFLTVASCALAAPQGRKDLPGRQVKVAAIPIGFGGKRDEKLKLALDHLETAGKAGVDIACLPEEFAGYDKAEPVPGPITQAIAEMAKKHRMYVICPIREQAADEQVFNTAVLIDRNGKIIGCYRKVFVFWGEGVNVSKDGVKVFDLDFGRISILTCFDANFSELWQEAEQKGAEIVFWPSAYGGGMPLNGYAMCHNYYVVPVGKGNIIDITGQSPASVEKPRPDQFIATLDLDRTLIHVDFNKEKVERLLKEHTGELELEREYPLEAWYLLRSARPGVLVRELLKEHKIEPLRDYRHRSREQINQARKEGKRI